MKKVITRKLFANIKALVNQSKTELAQVINTTLTETYFHIGRLIVEFEQEGNLRAEYAKATLQNLSKSLIAELGRGFSVDNLENMRKFYINYKSLYTKHVEGNQKSETVSRKLKKSENEETLSRKLSLSPFYLSWSHYIILLRIDEERERKFYEIEATNEMWSTRELQRNYDTALYERLVLSRDKGKVKELSKKGHIIKKPFDIIKDPLVLEFLNLKQQESYTESDLEKAILDQIEDFLKELGKGFLFVEKQESIIIDGEAYKIDLVFYHRILRCFVLIDLKLGTLKHGDIGQLQMYVNYYDAVKRTANEEKTIGIVLCKNKKENVIKYTLGENNKQIFATKYKMFFPEKEVLTLLDDNNRALKKIEKSTKKNK